MDKLLGYINSLTLDEQIAYAQRCGTTIGYLRKACSRKQLMGEGLVARLSEESGRVVRPEDIRPDVDWNYLRNALSEDAQNLASSTLTATETVAQPDTLRAGLVRRKNPRRKNDPRPDLGRRENLPSPVLGVTTSQVN